MIRYKHLFRICLLAMTVQTAMAQKNGNNSSYSRFGLGTLNDQSQGFNRNMAGVGQGIRIGNRINIANPASYSGIDSLSFIFDVGMNLSVGSMKQNNNRINLRNCGLDYVNAGFRLKPGLGMSLGFVPMTSIGYNFSTENKVTNDFNTLQPITALSKYTGDGGLHQIYIGAGWNPLWDLSIGLNVSYLWGNYHHELKQTFSENGSTSTSYSGLNAVQDADIQTYKIEIGLQYPIRINKDNRITLGITAGLGHRIKTDATLIRYTSVGDSLQAKASQPFDLPYTYSGGISWEHKDNWLVAADVKHERWADCSVPVMTSTETELLYSGQKGQYKNRTKIMIGGQYTPSPLERKYRKRIQYRAGASYSTPYLMVNGYDGPKEYSLTAGVGLPITNSLNNRSIVNFGVEWLHRAPSSAPSMITENYVLFHIGITFNEMWFMKRRIK